MITFGNWGGLPQYLPASAHSRVPRRAAHPRKSSASSTTASNGRAQSAQSPCACATPTRSRASGTSCIRFGDCRASALLDVIAKTPQTKALEVAMAREAGLKPNIAFALVAMRRSLDLPRGAALTIYACGRSLGWVAHALEQASSGELIRPRAR